MRRTAARVVHLTEPGRKTSACAFADHQHAMECAASGLTPAERTRAAGLWRQLGCTARSLL
jgi:hypothetical protein